MIPVKVRLIVFQERPLKRKRKKRDTKWHNHRHSARTVFPLEFPTCTPVAMALAGAHAWLDDPGRELPKLVNVPHAACIPETKRFEKRFEKHPTTRTILSSEAESTVGFHG